MATIIRFATPRWAWLSFWTLGGITLYAKTTHHSFVFGCIFAPMLLFFAASGIWQTLGIRSSVFGWLSALHTSARFKNGHEPSSPAFRLLVIIMALSFVISVILGVIMAFKFTKSRKAAFYCLLLGVIIPSVLVLLRTSI